MPGGRIPQAFAGAAAEQLTGGGPTYGGRVAAGQPTSAGLQAGGTQSSNLDAEEAQLLQRASTFQKNEFRKTRVAENLNLSTLNQPLKHAVLSSLDDLAVDLALSDTLNVLA